MGVTPTQLAKKRKKSQKAISSSKSTEQLMNEVDVMSKTILKMKKAMLSFGIDITKIPDDDEEDEVSITNTIYVMFRLGHAYLLYIIHS